MLPIVWQYLLKEYLKVMSLSVIAFVIVLLTTRLDDVAHFAALDASGLLIFQFVLHQIPYILPIAIPIGCLISALLLVKQLSKTHELTALRACGMGISDFLTPILICASMITIGNFYLVSELATNSHFHTSRWRNELLLINPLLLLKNKHLMETRGAFFEPLGHSKIGEVATQVVLALPNKNQERLHLFLADEFRIANENLLCKNVSMISSGQSMTDTNENFDHLLIENMKEVTTPTHDFSQLFNFKLKEIKPDHLSMSLLLSRIDEMKENKESQGIQQSQVDQENQENRVNKKNEENNANTEINKNNDELTRSYTEIMRRISLSLAAFTFTLMGCAFGMNISRGESFWNGIWVILLAALYLICYFIARGVDHKFATALTYYFMPHFLIIALSIWMLRRISRGIE